LFFPLHFTPNSRFFKKAIGGDAGKVGFKRDIGGKGYAVLVPRQFAAEMDRGPLPFKKSKRGDMREG